MTASIGEMIKAFRIQKNLTQEEIANKLNVSKGTISRYETGKRIPNINTLKDIAEILNVPVSLLMEKNTLESNKRTSFDIALEFIANPVIEKTFGYNYDELIKDKYDKILISTIEKAIQDTIKTISNDQNHQN